MQSASSAPDIAQRNFHSALHVLVGVGVIALAFLGFYLESARPYPNAHSLYADCAAGGRQPDAAALERRSRCARGAPSLHQEQLSTVMVLSAPR
jgi:hypothetical protein